MSKHKTTSFKATTGKLSINMWSRTGTAAVDSVQYKQEEDRSGAACLRDESVLHDCS